MKKFTKLLGIVLIIALVMSMGIMAYATEGGTTADTVTITVNRDSTYDGDPETAGRAYTWYKIFSATYATSVSSNASGYETDGSATFDNTATEGIAYYVTPAVAAALGTIDATTHAWTPNTGNKWFDLVYSSGSGNYTVAWREGVTANVDALQEAAAWLIANNAFETSGNMSFNAAATEDDAASWTADVTKGYYVIKGDVGDNLVAATTDISINEKNDYPPQDKTQTDKANPADADFKDDAVNVKVGDVISYEVKVTIPKTAAVGNTIQVWDTPSDGLDYNNDVVVKTGSNTGNATIADGTLGTGEIWHKVITVVDGSQGTDVVFSFTCTVNSDALVDTERENTSQIKYGNNYTSVPDTVEFDIGAAAIVKYDGATADLNKTTGVLTVKDGVEKIKYLAATFELKDAAGNAVNVTGANGVYTVDATSESNEVVSDKAHDGLILIYGLDPAVTYTLTETKTENGYNLLTSDVELTVVKAETGTGDAAVNCTKVVVDGIDGVYAGDQNAAAANTLTLTATQVNKVENNSGTVLPSTGGIGTTIFYVVGSILVVAAGVLLITKKRMSREG